VRIIGVSLGRLYYRRHNLQIVPAEAQSPIVLLSAGLSRRPNLARCAALRRLAGSASHFSTDPTDPAPRYSSRRASVGLTFEARHAGTNATEKVLEKVLVAIGVSLLLISLLESRLARFLSAGTIQGAAGLIDSWP
jgi:hypothetical protein